MSDTILWPTLIIGGLVACFGWVLYWTGLHVLGAFLGGGMGVGLAWLSAVQFGIEEQVLLLAGMGGLLGVVLGVFLVRALNVYFFFFIGAMAGAPAALSIFTKADVASGTGAGLAAMLAGALVGGLIALKFRRYLVAFVSALLGSALIAISLPEENRVWILVPAFLTSFLIQTGFIRAFVSDDDLERVARKMRREGLAEEPPRR